MLKSEQRQRQDVDELDGALVLRQLEQQAERRLTEPEVRSRVDVTHRLALNVSQDALTSRLHVQHVAPQASGSSPVPLPSITIAILGRHPPTRIPLATIVIDVDHDGSYNSPP